MGIINDVKETARKATNTVVDKTQEALDIPKSPKELAKRMMEHLTRQEYHEVANMLSAEIRKYANNMGIENMELVKTNLAVFEQATDAMADDLENNDYKQVIVGLEKLENSIPGELARTYGVLQTVKDFLNNVVKTLKKHIESGTTPEFESMTGKVEDLFDRTGKK